MLKKEGIYKKANSDKATCYGGFGGVGVENWILQNGGSFVKAMKTFLEAAEKAESFDEFQEIYPIFDFGQNHMSKGYRHDSYIRGISEKGYAKMKEVFKRYIKELTGQEQPHEKVKKQISIAKFGENAMEQQIRTSEYNEAANSINKEEQQIDNVSSLGGE